MRGLKGALVSGPRQGFEQVVEEARAQGLIHPLAREEHVVHLVHALDVACAVFLLGFQTCLGVCVRKVGTNTVHM